MITHQCVTFPIGNDVSFSLHHLPLLQMRFRHMDTVFMVAKFASAFPFMGIWGISFERDEEEKHWQRLLISSGVTA